MDTAILDTFRLEMSDPAKIGLAIALFVIMLSVALDLRLAHFAQVKDKPKPFMSGVIAQLIGLPLVTYLLCLVITPHPTIALGMLIVACCPGGTVSNLLTMLGRGNTALSVSLTATSSLFAAFMAPMTILFWVSLYGPTADLLKSIDFSVSEFLINTFVLLAIPLTIGMLAQYKFPNAMGRISKPLSAFAFLLLFLIIAVALYANWDGFLSLGWSIFLMLIGMTVLHNAAAFLVGIIAGQVSGASRQDKRSLIMEVGIQNSGLAIVIILGVLEGLGGAAAIIGIWGTWHIIAGLTLVAIFRAQDRRNQNA